MQQLFNRLKQDTDQDRLAAHLKWFAGVRRDTGSTGEEKAARYIAQAAGETGLSVTMHEFDAFLSFPGAAALQAPAQELTFTCITHSFTASTPGGGTSAPAVLFDPEADDPAVTRDQIAVVSGICAPITVLLLSRAGAAGAVFINPGESLHYMTGTTIWGTPSPDQLERLPSLPAVSVNNTDGNTIRQLIAAGPLSLTVTAKVDTGWRRSLLPEVVIPGSGPESEDFVLIGAHYCSWEYGITDNATGTACLLELTRLLQAEQRHLKRSIRIAWWPGHSHGRYAGSSWYADTFFREIADHCVAYHNIDSPGVRGATHYVARHTTADIEDYCTELIHAATGQSAPVNRPSRAADQSFLANGVPSFSTYPFLPEEHPDHRAWTGGAANAWWWHTKEDTLDKADPALLALDTAISAAGALHLATVDQLPLDPHAPAAEIRAFAEELTAAAGSSVDTEAFVKAACTYEEATAALSSLRGSKLSSAQVRALNRALIQLGRYVTPLIYSRGGRYANDPAELSPIMRNNRNTRFPGLAEGLELGDLSGDVRAGFIAAGLVRQLNRAVDHLLEATLVATSTLAAFGHAETGEAMS